MKIKLLIELDCDDNVYGESEEDHASFLCDVLGANPDDANERLILHSNLIGQEIGTVNVICTMSTEGKEGR